MRFQEEQMKKFFRVQTSEGEWLFFFDNFNELKEAIEKGK